ncbi:MAG: T9SS type A sorting domain-containing protein [Candidatus Latescibacteria bacterium]|nr:T9SS type A sorting domain-containing protein [Candidatus Latescibacterota bacterium]
MEGLFIYNSLDGTFTRFSESNGITDTSINDIAIGLDGEKWIATSSGVFHYGNGSWDFYSNDSFFSGNTIHTIIIDKEYTVWFISRKNIVTFDGSAWAEYTVPWNENRMYLTSGIVDKNGILWCGSEHKGIVSFDGSIWTYYNQFDDIYNMNFITFDVDDENTLYCGTFNGRLVTYDGELWTEKVLFESSTSRLYDIAVEHPNKIWAATNDGLYLIEDNHVRVYEHDGSLFNSSLRSITVDDDGIVWIGGNYCISSFFNGKFLKSKIIDGPYYNTVWSITIDTDNIIWFGHESQGLTRYDHFNWTVHLLDLESIGRGIASDSNNNIWITKGANAGIMYDGDEILPFSFGGVFYEIDGYQNSYNSFIKQVIVDNQDRVWFSGFDYEWMDASYGYSVSIKDNQIENYFFQKVITTDSKNTYGIDENGEISRYTDKDWEYLLSTGFPSSEETNKTFVIDNEGKLWYIARRDLKSLISAYDSTSIEIFNYENSPLPNSLFYSIEVDRNNIKWIGTVDGVCRFDGETCTIFNTENSGLCDNNVIAIAVEENNTIWFGTDNGVSRYTGEIITTSVDEENQTPETLPIIKTYPNPFNPSTTIEFTLPESGFATITFYSMAGQKIRELKADHLPAGTHTLSWDGKDSNGSAVSSGIYITRLQAGKHTATGRMVLVR